MEIRVPIVKGERGWTVALPTYVMIPGSWEPVIEDRIHPDGVHSGVDLTDDELAALTVLVRVPDEPEEVG